MYEKDEIGASFMDGEFRIECGVEFHAEDTIEELSKELDRCGVEAWRHDATCSMPIMPPRASMHTQSSSMFASTCTYLFSCMEWFPYSDQIFTKLGVDECEDGHDVCMG